MALALLLGVALAWPLSRLWDGTGLLLGWSGQAQGEFESWWWLDWWIPRFAAARWVNLHGEFLQQCWAILAIPRDLDLGNYLEGLLLAQPCKTLLGPVAGHNLHVALVLFLNVEAALFLVKAFLSLSHPDSSARPWRIALVTAAALAVALNPVTLWDLAQSRFGQALLAPWLLLLAFIFEAMRTGSRHARAGVAITFALTALVYWYAAFFVAILALPLALFTARRPLHADGEDARTRSRALAGALVLGFIAVIPLGLPFLVGSGGTAPPHALSRPRGTGGRRHSGAHPADRPWARPSSWPRAWISSIPSAPLEGPPCPGHGSSLQAWACSWAWPAHRPGP